MRFLDTCAFKADPSSTVFVSEKKKAGNQQEYKIVVRNEELYKIHLGMTRQIL